MTPNIEDSIVLITSRDNKEFGTGFIIRQVRGITYVLTCAHVVEAAGGSDKVKVDGIEASVVVSGKEIGVDLAVLKVDGLSQRSVVICHVGGETGSPFRTIGWQSFGKDVSGKELNRIQPLSGKLGEAAGLQPRQGGVRVKAWELRIAEEDSLQPGYSGSPVVDDEDNVIAVVSHRQGDKSGLAISIEELKNIWLLPDSEQLHQMLLELGYQGQVQVFRQLTRKTKPLFAFTIHGEESYGQRWLLNRLITWYLPERERTTASLAKIDLGALGRHNNSSRPDAG